MTTVMFLRSSNGDDMEDRSGWRTAKGRNWYLPQGWRTGIRVGRAQRPASSCLQGQTLQFPQSNGTLPVVMRESHSTPAVW